MLRTCICASVRILFLRRDCLIIPEIETIMKKSTLLALMTLLLLRAWAQDATPVKSKIAEVTVYLQNAQITREATVQVNRGDNFFRFPNLESSINPATIQASAPDMVLLNSVRHEVNYLRNTDLSPEVKVLQDSLRLLAEAMAQIDQADDILNKELTLIQSNQVIGSKEKGLTAEQLSKMADFYRTRILQIHQQRHKLGLEKRKLALASQRLTNQLGPVRERLNLPSNDILVHIKSDVARSISLAVRYVVSGPNWTPSYDLRASDPSKPVKLDYRAVVNTGEDWNGVLISLSTGNPERGGTKPQLEPWKLYAQSSFGYQAVSVTAKKGRQDISSDDYAGSYAEEEGGNMTLANYTTVREGAVTTEFEIKLPQDIPGDGKEVQIFIQSSDLEAAFRHYAAPKVDPDAFLLASVTGWEGLNLLPGAVNIFFEGTYVAKAMLDPTIAADTLNFSLGRDGKVVVKREMLKDFSSQRTIGTNKERTFGYEITVRNTKTKPVNLKLEDQIPLSQNSDIEVKAIEISGADLNPETGKLLWNLTLQPNETQKFRLVFSVKYPKNKIINGL